MAGHTGALRQEHDFVVIFHLIDKKTYSRECPLTGHSQTYIFHRALTDVHFEMFWIYIIFEHVFINKKFTFSSGRAKNL